MKRLLVVTLLSLLSLTATAQAPPVITSISPDSGPSRGGNDVVITGSGFATTIICILPCPPIVTFGDVDVPVKEDSNTRLVVTAPPHPAGKVDVTVRISDHRSVTVAGAYTYTSGAEDAWEKVLLPIYLDGPVDGANGSRWQTDFWLRNNGSRRTEIAPWPCPDGGACPAVFPWTHEVPAGGTQHGLAPFFRVPGSNQSRLLFIRRTEGHDLSMSLRVADGSRSTLNAGTELPVVREDEYETRTVNLLNVPYDPSKFRLHLRLYDVTLTESRFRVTLYAQKEGAPSPIEHTVELTASTTERGEFRSQAAFALYDFAELEPLDKVWPSAFRIEITPLTPGSRFYPLVSVTNNETQLITLITAQ